MMTQPAKLLAIDGGTPVRTEGFPAWPYFDDTERTALMRALDQGQWWRVGGAQVTSFESEFAAFVGAPAALAVSTGTHALELALELLGVGPGDEVIVPAFTFIATSNAVQRLGATPVPVDVDPDTYCIDLAAADAAHGPRTRVVIPVHLAGMVADMNGLGEWAARRGVTIVQDAAHAHGAVWQGKRLGELGTLCCYSFQNGKLMTAGEGGAVALPDAARYAEAFARHSCGRPIGDRHYQHLMPSSNFRMSEFNGAVLRAQLMRLPEQNAHRAAQWKRLSTELATIDGVTIQGEDPRCDVRTHYMAMFTVAPEMLNKVSASALVDALVAEGIPAFVNFPPVYRTEAFWAGSVAGLPGAEALAEQCPHTEHISAYGVWLHHRVLLGGDREVDDVVEAVAKVLTGLASRA
jgi:3-amino-5-hydroxybenzoate synthase